MARRRVLVDARFVTSAPTSSHARYLRELARCWAEAPGSLEFLLLAPGPLPANLPSSPWVRWLAAPPPLSQLGRQAAGGRLWLNSIFTIASVVARPNLLFFPYPFVPRVVTAPAVVTLHDVCFHTQPQSFADGGRSLDQRARRAVHAAQAMIVVSTASLAAVVAAYSVDQRRMTVVHHGIASTFNPRRTALDDEIRHLLQLEKPYFVCVSTHEPRKNLQILAHAYVQLLRTMDAAQPIREYPTLLLIGRRTDYSAKLEAILAESPTALAHTRLVSSVSDAELAAIYRGAAATAVPSTCEGFGFPLLEALACGSPVLAADQPVFRELAGDAAVYLPPQDPAAWAAELHRMLANDGSRSSAAQAVAAAIANRFTWQTCARATLTVLESAAGC